MLSRVAVFFLLEGWWKTLKLHVCPTASNLRLLGHLMKQNTVSPNWGGSQKAHHIWGAGVISFHPVNDTTRVYYTEVDILKGGPE